MRSCIILRLFYLPVVFGQACRKRFSWRALQMNEDKKAPSLMKMEEAAGLSDPHIRFSSTLAFTICHFYPLRNTENTTLPCYTLKTKRVFL